MKVWFACYGVMDSEVCVCVVCLSVVCDVVVDVLMKYLVELVAGVGVVVED